MTVKELRELLSETPDDMKVMVIVENHLKLGMFAFADACICDTGIATLGPDELNEKDGETVFLILPHGSGVPEDEIDNEENKSPQLN